VQSGDGIVGEEWIRSTNQRKVMPQVLGGFAKVHWSDLVARGNPLIERGENTHAELTRQSWLTDQQQRARRS